MLFWRFRRLGTRVNRQELAAWAQDDQPRFRRRPHRARQKLPSPRRHWPARRPPDLAGVLENTCNSPTLTFLTWNPRICYTPIGNKVLLLPTNNASRQVIDHTRSMNSFRRNDQLQHLISTYSLVSESSSQLIDNRSSYSNTELLISTQNHPKTFTTDL